MKKSQSIRVIAAHRLVLAAAAEPRRGCCGEGGGVLEGQDAQSGKGWEGDERRITGREGAASAEGEMMWVVLLGEYEKEQTHTWLKAIPKASVLKPVKSVCCRILSKRGRSAVKRLKKRV